MELGRSVAYAAVLPVIDMGVGEGIMRVRTRAGLVGLTAILATSCATSGGGAGEKPASSGTPTQVTQVITQAPTPQAPASTVDPNNAVCDSVHGYVLDRIRPTFDSWKPDSNEFDHRVARLLRAEATHLYALSRKANGAVQSAISDEAKGLVDISVAMETEDDASLGTAASAANGSLAALRGTCGF